jgi:hypothetical protein
VRLTGGAGGGGAAGNEIPSQSPLLFEVTFGAFPTPCDTISVVRVQLLRPLLTVVTL